MAQQTHTFTSSQPQLGPFKIKVPVSLTFTATPPDGWRPVSGVATRLLHLRTREGSPRETEVAEVKISGGGMVVVERTGFGNKQPQWRDHQPIKFNRPSDGRYVFSFAGGVVKVNDESGSTTLAPADGTELELLLGFTKLDGELVAPIGWTVVYDIVDGGTGEVPPPPGNDAGAALIADLTAVVRKYKVTAR